MSKVTMKNKWFYLISAVILITLISLLIVQKNAKINTIKGGKLSITASFYPMYFFASEIGSEKAEVKNLTPLGVEPHDYDPSPGDIARIEDGDMLVLNGVAEAWADKVKDNLKGKNVKIVIAGEGLFTKKDPHVWLNPLLAKKQVGLITRGYISIDPLNKNYYLDNQKKLNDKLDKLDREYKQGLQNCQSTDFITSHAAFSYLAEAYSLNQVPISGLSPDHEPSARELAEIAKFAREHDIKYIFFESLVSPKLSETIAQEIGAKTLVLDPIEGISDDDMKQGKNYLAVMENNLKNLQTALGCMPK